MLASAGCVPLVWWFLFAPEDLTVKQFTVDGKTFEETAPVVAADVAIARFQARRDLMNAWYSGNGGLGHHQELFESWVASRSGQFISIEWQEIGCLYDGNDFRSAAEEALYFIADGDLSAKKPLAQLSTIFEDRRFLTLPELDAQDVEQEDWWNYYRIMGDSHLAQAPW